MMRSAETRLRLAHENVLWNSKTALAPAAPSPRQVRPSVRRPPISLSVNSSHGFPDQVVQRRECRRVKPQRFVLGQRHSGLKIRPPPAARTQPATRVRLSFQCSGPVGAGTRNTFSAGASPQSRSSDHRRSRRAAAPLALGRHPAEPTHPPVGPVDARPESSRHIAPGLALVLGRQDHRAVQLEQRIVVREGQGRLECLQDRSVDEGFGTPVRPDWAPDWACPPPWGAASGWQPGWVSERRCWQRGRRIVGLTARRQRDDNGHRGHPPCRPAHKGILPETTPTVSQANISWPFLSEHSTRDAALRDQRRGSGSRSVNYFSSWSSVTRASGVIWNHQVRPRKDLAGMSTGGRPRFSPPVVALMWCSRERPALSGSVGVLS